MKKFSKLFALLLTVCLLVGAIAIVASATVPAAPVTTDFGKSEDYEDGKHSNFDPGSALGTTNACSSIEIIDTGSNKYLRYAYKATPGDVLGTDGKPSVADYYRRDFVFASYASNKVATPLSDYSYYTIDFDIAADQYKALIGYEVVDKVTTTVSGDETTNAHVFDVRELWKMYETFDENVVRADVIAAASKFEADVSAAVLALTSGDNVSESTEGDVVKTTIDTYASEDISASTDVEAFIATHTVSEAEALDSKRLAYAEGTNIAIDNRPWLGTAMGSGYSVLAIKLVYKDGAWQVYAGGNKTGYTMSDNLGEWNHFTYAVKTVIKNVGTEAEPKYSLGHSEVRLYMNGILLETRKINANNDAYKDTILDVSPRALCWYNVERVQNGGDITQKFSMAVDNVNTAFYKVVEDNDDFSKIVPYTSGEGNYGIDDLFNDEDETKSIAHCCDVLYSKDSYTAANVGGYVKVDGTKYTTPSIAYEKIASGGVATIETTLDLKNITPATYTEIKILCESDVKVTLSDTSIREGARLDKVADGYVVRGNQLVLPTEGSGDTLKYGTYAYSTYEASNAAPGFGFNQQMDTYAYTGSDAIVTNPVTGNRYFSLRRNLSSGTTLICNDVTGYNEYNLGGWNANASSYKKNNMVTDYSYGVVDFDYGSDRYSVQVGYRIDVRNKEGSKKTADGVEYYPYTNTYQISPEYRTYTTIDEDQIQTDIDAAYQALVDSYGGSVTLPTKKSADKKTVLAEEQKNYSDIIGNLEQWKFTLDEALATKAVAHMPSSSFYLGIRTNSDATSYSSGKNGTFTDPKIYTIREGNDFYLSVDSDYDAGVDYKLPSEINEFTHISFIFTIKESTAYTYVFINGEYFKHSTQSAKAVMCMDGLRYQSSANYKATDAYALAIDNVAVSYYAKNYTSGDAFGLDDLIGEEKYNEKNLYDCVNVVYDKDYISPGGSVKVDDNATVSVPALVEKELEGIKNGSIVVSSKNIKNYLPASGVTEFSVVLEDGATFSVSEQAMRELLLVAAESENGVDVRVAKDGEKVSIVWIDAEGGEYEVIKREEIVYGLLPDASQFTVYESKFNADRTNMTTSVGSYLNWQIDLFDDGNLEALRPFTKEECEFATQEIAIYSNAKDVESIVFEDFVIGSYNEAGTFVPDLDSKGGYSQYNNIATLKSEAEAAADGATVILLIDEALDVGAETYIAIGENKTLTVDINGKTIAHSYGCSSNYGNPLFLLFEGSTLNLISSVEGAHLLEGKIANDKNTEIYGGGSIIAVNSGTDSCTININGDITFSAGTVFKLSAKGTQESVDANNNDKNIAINANGAKFYSPIRSSYGFICNQAVDVVVNFENCKFFVQNSTYAMFHDYTNSGTTIYNSEMDFYAKNCEFVSVKADGTPYGKIFYRASANSSVTLEDCIVIGQLGNKESDFSSSITLKGNNVFATNQLSILTGYRTTLAEGTIGVALNDSSVNHNITVSVKHSKLANDVSLMLKDSAGKYYLDPICYDPEGVTIDVSAAINFVTFEEGSAPSYVAEIDWVGLDDVSVGKTYAFVGDAPKEIKAVTKLPGTASVTSDWYTKSFVWANTESGKYVVAEGANTFKPTASYETKILGMKQNATLFTDMTYNLYLPVSADVSGVSVVGADLAESTIEIGGVTYYVVSVTPEIEDFAAAEATVKFVADGVALEYDVILDVVSYADAVAKYYGHATKESTLVYEMMNYKECAAELLNPSFEAPENLVVFKSSHAECECGVGEVVISEEEKAVDYSALIAKGVTGVSYIVNLDEMGMVISVGEGVEVTSVTYTDALGRVITHTVESGNLVAKNGYYLVTGVSAAYIDNIMTITVDGATGTYCLGKYIVNQPGVAIAEAIYKYAVAAENFKNIVKE